jgi:hypothetical protein
MIAPVIITTEIMYPAPFSLNLLITIEIEKMYAIKLMSVREIV